MVEVEERKKNFEKTQLYYQSEEHLMQKEILSLVFQDQEDSD
jgi:hypothetical protein